MPAYSSCFMDKAFYIILRSRQQFSATGRYITSLIRVKVVPWMLLANVLLYTVPGIDLNLMVGIRALFSRNARQKLPVPTSEITYTWHLVQCMGITSLFSCAPLPLYASQAPGSSALEKPDRQAGEGSEKHEHNGTDSTGYLVPRIYTNCQVPVPNTWGSRGPTLMRSL